MESQYPLKCTRNTKFMCLSSFLVRTNIIMYISIGHLLTSSNYDDTEKKVTGGRNGFGAKLTNIFSKKFIIEIVDSKKKKKYVQEFSNNMSKIESPKITTYDGDIDYT